MTDDGRQRPSNDDGLEQAQPPLDRLPETPGPTPKSKAALSLVKAAPAATARSALGATTGLTPDQERVVACVFSRFVGVRDARNWIGHLNRLLAGIGEIPSGPGSRGGWPQWNSGLKNLRAFEPDLKVSARTIDLWWHEAEEEADYVLSPERIRTFFPPEIWQAAWALIESGPLKAARRVERVCRRWADGQTADGKAGRAAIGDNVVEHYLGVFKRFARELDEVRKLGASELGLSPSAFAPLEGWLISELPKLKTPRELGAKPINRDRTAPPFRAFRRALKSVAREAEARKGRPELRDSAYKHIRNRVLLALIALFGPRKTNIGLLQVGDYEREHRFPDGSVGPALAFRHFKDQPGLVRYKGLPHLVAEWLEEWLELAGILDDPEAYIWRPADDRDREYDEEPSLKVVVYTTVNEVSGFAGKRCSPHTIRHLCGKVAVAVGVEWLFENKHRLLHEDMQGLPSSAQTFEDIALDHVFNDPTDRYKDLNSEQGRELWSREIANLAWELIWGDKGARTGPDWHRIDAATVEVRDAALHEADLRARIHTVRSQQQALLSTALAQAGSLKTRELVLAQLQAGTLNVETADLADQLSAATRRVEQARLEYQHARAARIPVPDEWSDAQVAAELERLDDIDSSTAGDGQPPPRPPQLQRKKILAREFRWAVGENVLGEKTLQRYLRGESLRYASRLFNIDPASALPLGVHRPSDKITEITVDDLPLENYPDAVLRRLRWLQTQPRPKRGQRPGNGFGS